MTDKDKLPPEQSDYQVIGDVMTITGKDMNRFTDPKYPWRDFSGRHDPPYRKQVKDILEARDKEVDHYIVTRRRYWLQVNPPYHYAVDTQVQITHHQGYIEHKSHTWSETDTVTERIAADLGIDLSVGGEDPGIPLVPPVALGGLDPPPGGGGSGPGGGGGSGVNADSSFSLEMQKTLHIMDTDEQTYTNDVTNTITEDFKAGTTYIFWRKMEDVVVQRVNKNSSDPEVVSLVTATPGFEYTDAFPSVSGGGSGGGDIH
jgi:hypothetical protein